MVTIVPTPAGLWPPPAASPVPACERQYVRFQLHYCHLVSKVADVGSNKTSLKVFFFPRRKNGDSQPRSKHRIISTIKNFLKIFGLGVEV